MGRRKTSGGKGGDPGGDPPRRSSRERKKASFGSDFEQDNLGSPPAKKSKPDPKPSDPKPSDPTPGTSKDPDPVPPVPDPVPTGSITWPSDEEHWKLPQLPNNHSKCLYIFGNARICM